MAGITQYLAILNSVARSFLAGSDSNGNLSPAHTLVDQNGVPVSTGAPLPVSDAALTTANGYLATLASEDAGLATSALQTAGNVTLVSILTALASTSTAALQTAANTVLATISGYLSTLAGAVSAGKVAVSGTFWQTTQPVSGTVGLSGSLPDTAGGALAAIAAAEVAGNTALASILSALLANTAIVPPVMRGQGTFTASTISAAVNAALTKTANSAAFPTAALGGTLRIKSMGTNTSGAWISWLGGTASSAGCEYILPGESQTKYLPTQNMTSAPPQVVAVSGTPVFELEW